MQAKQKCKCGICDMGFIYEPHRYEGRRLRGYDMMVCSSCYASHHDGWNPDAEEKLIAHMQRKGIQIPPRNEKGWLPRDYPVS